VKKSGTETVVGFREILVQVEGLAVGGGGFLVFAFMEKSETFVGVKVVVLRSDLERLVEIGDRFGIVAGSIEGFAKVVESVDVIGLHLEGLAEKRDGLIVLLFVQQIEALGVEFGSFGRLLVGNTRRRGISS